ncbi:substrate-binding domain-containing protein [Coraliomargarita algicola]|uniref:Substrate-binding domain-containing protein n=1 Tax=Coraliomargarita algicola TaxID=3092156 RepID=A0ABZ0RNK9_9BACT|nr:substrate-binding domain-containing protein [Coraliomargarita sp. J2-16]WPJ96703.1 substrate-binding domain-containing protein [Coraliomargarita sp. J2-16]
MKSLSPISVRGPNKQPHVIAALTNLAHELGPGGRLPTGRVLMESLGVTKATLSKSLVHLQNKGVLRCVQGSGIYVSDTLAQQRIALVFGGNIFSPSGSEFGRMFLQQSSRLANRSDKRLSCFLDVPEMSDQKVAGEAQVHKDLLEALQDDKIDGIILMGRNSEEQEAWLRSQNIPVIGTSDDGQSTSVSAHTVVLDYDALISMGLDSLIESGCARVGFITPRKYDYKKFQKFIEAKGLDYVVDRVVRPMRGEDSPDTTREGLGRAYAEQWLDSVGWWTHPDQRPDGLLISDDVMCRGVLSYFSRNGIEPGRDITVCSHANTGSFLLSEWEGAILRMELDPKAMAEAIFEMLDDLIAGKVREPYYIQPVRAS